MPTATLTLSAITWDILPEIFTVGSFSVRYYGLMWTLAFWTGLVQMQHIYKRESIKPLSIDTLLIAIILGTLLGARVVHCLFYNPEPYLAEPWKILYVWQGGLASHGGTLGLMAAIIWYARKSQTETLMWLLDRLTLAALSGAFFIRMGNLFNSEILGHPSDVPWAFTFVNAYPPSMALAPRHPVQLYEAICYLTLFILTFVLYRSTTIGQRRGAILGLGMTGVFIARFILEWFKDQGIVAYTSSSSLTVGQWLSIPFIIVGIGLVVTAYRRPKVSPSSQEST